MMPAPFVWRGPKTRLIVVNISRDTIVNVEQIDDETLEEEEQEVPELETAVNVCFIVSFGPLILYFCQDNLFLIQTIFKIPLSEGVKAPIAATEELFDVEKDVVDGHLHFQDEGVASLFENSKELLAEVIEEELKVRATVPAATIVI